VFEDDFENTYQSVANRLVQPRSPLQISRQKPTSRILSGRTSLLLVLTFLRQKPHYRLLGRIFGISNSTVHRELVHALPILASSLTSIRWPRSWDSLPVGIEGSQFAVDATAHYRNRVHPGQRLWYRGDKKGHFMAVQIVVALNGTILSVHFLKGHNNDQGVFNLTVREKIENDNVVGIGDRGYTHFLLVTPDDLPKYLQHLQAAQRTVVEIVFGMVKIWQFAAEKVTQAPELQVLGLKIIYELTNMLLLQFPRVVVNVINH